MTSVSFRDAAQVLRPPEDGLAYLRHDRAGSLRLDAGSLAVIDGRIACFEADAGADVRIDASGCAVLPGFVDCHTHLPFAGWRAEEYALKVTGVPYLEISKRGGGIASSARALAAATDEAVLAQGAALAAEMLAHGTTAFEGKTGYGLSVEAEERAVRLGRALGERVPQATTVTGLFGHAVPAGYTADEWMAEADGLAARTGVDALDLFVEVGAFSNAHLTRMGELAAREGVALRAHVEQFASHRSIPVALEAGARSLDHLACLHPDDVEPLARSECAAVLLPGAEFLGAEELPPARALAEAGAICVLATDLNPGTSPVCSLPAIIALAVRRYGWSVREALLAVTLNAAYVLGWSDERGSIEVGKRADLVLLDGPVEHVPYRFAHNPVAAVVLGGELAWLRPDQAWRIA